MSRTHFACTVAVAAALALAPVASRAAGPCSDDIATLGRQLSTMNGLGAPLSEPDQGQKVDKNAQNQGDASPSDRKQSGGASLVGGGSPGTVGGAAGAVGGGGINKQPDAVASGQIATSSADVRRQSAGKPTMAQQAVRDNGKGDGNATMAANDKVSQAKAALQRATDLSAKGDKSCAQAVTEARNLIPQH